MTEKQINIIQKTIEVINEKGITWTTDDVCKHVGIAKGTLFHHFKSKEELLDSCYRYIRQVHFDFMSNGLNMNVKDDKEFLGLIVERFINYGINYYAHIQFVENYHNCKGTSQNDFTYYNPDAIYINDRLTEIIKESKPSHMPASFYHMSVRTTGFRIAKYASENPDIKENKEIKKELENFYIKTIMA